jgi:hypothetical protein
MLGNANSLKVWFAFEAWQVFQFSLLIWQIIHVQSILIYRKVQNKYWTMDAS